MTKTEFETVLKEALKAYQDCHEEKSSGERSTDFKASLPVTSEEFVEIMKRCCPGGYNEFHEIAAENVRALFGDKAEYTIAREGSPCVYVKVTKVNFERKISLSDLKADEISFEGENVFRVWWD